MAGNRAALWAGDIAAGEAVIEPWRALQPTVDLVGPMPYVEFQHMIDYPPSNSRSRRGALLIDVSTT